MSRGRTTSMSVKSGVSTVGSVFRSFVAEPSDTELRQEVSSFIFGSGVQASCEPGAPGDAEDGESCSSQSQGSRSTSGVVARGLAWSREPSTGSYNIPPETLEDGAAISQEPRPTLLQSRPAAGTAKSSAAGDERQAKSPPKEQGEVRWPAADAELGQEDGEKLEDGKAEGHLELTPVQAKERVRL